MSQMAAVIFTLGMLLGSISTNTQAAERAKTLPRPIIAELFAKPTAFAGRRIAIYGLVIESNPTGTEFLLQDVSQRPLKIVGGNRLKAAAGDQLTVIGIFHAAHPPYVAVEILSPTRVIGEGGCC
jgi:hypothetical protein